MSDSRIVMARTIDGKRVATSTSDMTFRVSTYGVVLDRGNVLLVPQWDGYDIPGGGVELGESLPDAVRREVREETGMEVEPDTAQVLCAMDDFFIHPTDGKAYHYLLLYYACRLTGGTLSDEGFEDDERGYAKMAEWIPIEEVHRLKFYNPVDNVAVIRSALAAQKA